MKKIIILFIVLTVLSSCSFGINSELSDAKKELLGEDNIENQDDKLFKKDDSVPGLGKNDALTGTTDSLLKNDISNSKIASYKINDLTREQFIKLDNLDGKIKNVLSGIEITGETIGVVDKIIVKFENTTSDFPVDVYELGQFKSGDKKFTYRAKSEFKVLDYGENNYIFEVYSGDEISKLKLTIDIPKDIDESNTEKTKIINDNISYEKKIIGNGSGSVYLSFPKSDIFGVPLSVGTDLITYSKIDDLEIKRTNIGTGTVNCDNMTDYLKENIGGWFYWNTCRDIIKDKGISVFVVRLKGDKYEYKKIYFDYNHGLIGYYVISNSIDADKENVSKEISEINSELKEKNKNNTVAYDNYTKLEAVDKLFKEIVR